MMYPHLFTTLYLACYTLCISTHQVENFFLFDRYKYISKYEVTNQEYNTFLASVKDSAIYSNHLDIQPDNWTKLGGGKSYFIPFVKLYHVHEQYAGYPVVNIHYEGAVAYCSWLTAKYNSSVDRSYQQVVFRLPTLKEYKQISGRSSGKININDQELYEIDTTTVADPRMRAIINDPYGNQDLFMQMIPEILEKIQTKTSGFFVTRPVDRTSFEHQEIFQLYGNVSEMTDQKGIAFGQNWLSPCTKDLKYLSDTVVYQQASPLIGFRVIMEVIKK